MKSSASLIVMLMCLAPIVDCAPSARAAVSEDIRELIEAARGAPAPLCACAAHSVYNNWGWVDAPASPLGRPVGGRSRERRRLSDEDIRFLLTSLDTPDPCVRELAVRIVAGVRREEVANGLLQRLTAADSALRMTAALGLGLAEPRQALEPLIRATRDDAAGVRANAVWALGRIGDTRAVGAASTALADRSPMVRQAAAGTLGHLEAKGAVPGLSRALRDDREATVRRTAAWAIAQIGGEEAIQDLTVALQKDQDAGVREMCAWALGDLEGGRTATSALLTAAKKDDDAKVRETAVWSIGEHGDNSSAKSLGEILESDRSAEVRRTAAWALGQLGIRTAPRGLIALLSDRDPDIRTVAAWALGEIEDKAAVPALRTALAKETDKEARKAELRALVHSGEGAEDLSHLLESSDPEVRKTAIRGIAGESGFDPWPWPQPRPRPFP